jgi:hypothetical protein
VYHVCFKEAPGPEEAYRLLTDAHGHSLRVPAHPLDLHVHVGPYLKQRLSVEAFQSTDVEVQGVHLPPNSFDRLAFTEGTCGVDPFYRFVSEAGRPVQYGSWNVSSGEDLTYTFSVDLTRGAKAGHYSVCHCDAAKDTTLKQTMDLFYAHPGKVCRTENFARIDGYHILHDNSTRGVGPSVYTLPAVVIDSAAKLDVTFNVSVTWTDVSNMTTPAPIEYARSLQDAPEAMNTTDVNCINGTNGSNCSNASMISATEPPLTTAEPPMPVWIDPYTHVPMEVNVTAVLVEVTVPKEFVMNGPDDHFQVIDEWLELIYPAPDEFPNHTYNQWSNISHARLTVPVYGNSTTIYGRNGSVLTVSLDDCTVPPLEFDIVQERIVPHCANTTNFSDPNETSVCNPFGLPFGENILGEPNYDHIHYYTTPVAPWLLHAPLEDGGFGASHTYYFGPFSNLTARCTNVTAVLHIMEYQVLDLMNFTEHLNYTNYTAIRGHYVERDVIEDAGLGSALCVAKCDPASPTFNASKNQTCIAYDPVKMGKYGDAEPPIFPDDGMTRSASSHDNFPGVLQLFGAALCVSEMECRRLCTQLEGCNGIDAHHTLPLCYLTARAPAPYYSNATGTPTLVVEDVNDCAFPDDLIDAPHGGTFTSYERDVTTFPSESDTYGHMPARIGVDSMNTSELMDITRGRWSLDQPPAVLGYKLDQHTCGHKCGRYEEPCFGPHCYCEGHEHGDTPEDGTLCLPLALCYEACEQLAHCFGVSVLVGRPRCMLAMSTAVEHHAAHDFFERRSGLACTDVEDFTSILSTMTVTERVHLRRGDWVIGAGKRRPDCRDDDLLDEVDDLSFSLEITGQGLDWRRDRMLILDCGVSCGDPDLIPTDAIEKPVYHGVPSPSVEAFNVFHAWTSFIDRPANDAERIPFEYIAPNTYGTIAEVYCPGRNFDKYTLGHHAAHLCYKKCIVEAPCDSDDCFCEGLNDGQDGLDSEALCLSEALCRATCDRLDDCVGIDMHGERPRCYLNRGGWDEDDELQYAEAAEGWDRCSFGVVEKQLAIDMEYKFVFVYNQAVISAFADMHEDERPKFTLNRMLADLPAGRRLLGHEDVREHCYQAEEGDQGYSWGNLLRFKPIELSSGGRFRVCFCDHTLTDAEECKKAEDYSLDLGFVHASGVSCFLDQDRFKRDRHCVSQFHGGQRCYANPLDEPLVGPPQDQEIRPAWDDSDMSRDQS